MMRRAFVFLFALLCASPALATNLATLAITTAQSAQTTTVLQFKDGIPENLTLQATFTYGSGGTSADAWVQTSQDSGSTWTDCADFHFTTSSGRFIFNLSSLTPVTTEYTPTDGTLSANTSKDGVLGSMIRVKYTTVGTYAGGTKLSIDAQSRSRITTP